MSNEILPVGSIVKCKDKYIQIIHGYDITNNHFDYLFSAFPFSTINIDKLMNDYKKYEWFICNTIFHKEDITEVIFLGYKDVEFYEFEQRVKELYY